MSDKPDIFAKFRTGPEQRDTAGGEPEPEADDDDELYSLPPLQPESYIAFRLGKRRERMQITRAAQPMRFPAYHELLDLSFDQTRQETIYLYFRTMTVEVLGKNLWPVAHAISSGRCGAIYEHHAQLYPAKPRVGDPLIESIKLLPPEPLADDKED